MTIDEAIKFCHEKSENIKLKAEPQVFIDIAEWLGELKVYKECNISKTNFSMGYNKAIDDFAEKLSDECFEQSMTVVFENRVKADVITLDGLTEIILEIAQQLKEGAVDGNSTTDN